MFNLDRRRLLLASPALLPVGLRAQPAPRWPVDKPVRIIVPLAAGGTADFLARTTGNRLQEMTGQSFIVENRTGGGGAIGWQAAARAAPDGATIVVVDNALPIAVAAGRDVGFDARTDLVPVALMAQFAPILCVNPALPVTDLRSFVEYARARPEQLFFGSGGIGSVPHLQTELLMDVTGLRMNHVAYRGMAPAATDLVAGQVQLLLPVFPTVGGQLRGGTIRALAVGAAAGRMTALPGVPTAREQGIDFAPLTWFGLMAPRGTPPEVLAGMNTALSAVGNDDMRRRLEEVGAIVPATGIAAFRDTVVAETALWSRIIREKNIRVE